MCFVMILFIIYVLVGNVQSHLFFDSEMIFGFSFVYRFTVSGSIMSFEF